MLTQFPLILKQKLLIATNTWEFTFEVSGNSFSFKDGQYIWLILPKLYQDDVKKDREAFSIASSSLELPLIKIVFRDNEKSLYKNKLKQIEVGTKFDAWGPFGYLDFNNLPEKVCFIGGGVGSVPFFSLFDTFLKNLNSKIPQIEFVFCNSDTSRVFYKDKIEMYKSQIPNFVFTSIVGSQSSNYFSKIADKFDRYYVMGNQGFVNNVDKFIKNNTFFEEYYPVNNDMSIETLSSKIIATQNSILKTIIDNISNHIVLTDLNGRVFYANKEAERLTGYSNEEIIGNTPRLWGGHMELSTYQLMWKTIKTEKKVFKGELRNRRKNGEMYTAIATITPIFDDNGNLYAYAGIEEDITEKNKILEEHERKNKDLEKLNRLMIGREIRMAEMKKQLKMYNPSSVK